ncbi:hypothetical protein AVEN_15442-1 [Araneus ventricosus]|uniref:Uncharacterized protein n=1 Tax=Araneus ventricosus TaxID=182803 RepID=A0A4Y2QFM6_ARAVE|nr:hypothetical protein AVEN_142730-1 [Araneus ventricosus]GBN61577.1 hypothetical protein AVEN_15442-1 [Araneus ventricosus]
MQVSLEKQTEKTLNISAIRVQKLLINPCGLISIYGTPIPVDDLPLDGKERNREPDHKRIYRTTRSVVCGTARWDIEVAKKTYLNRNIQNNSTIACIVDPITKLILPPRPSPLSWNIPCQRQVISFSVSRPSHMFTTRLTCHQQHHVKVHVIILGCRD